MLALKTGQILFMHWILTSLITLSCSVKTYQVNRINESTYLVNSLPEDYDKRLKSSNDNIVVMNNDKRSFDPYTEIVNGGPKNLYKPKLSASYINKARENYFRKLFGTTTSSSLKTSPYYYKTPNFVFQLQQNIYTARKLASSLMLLVKNDMVRQNARLDFTKQKRLRRELNKKRRRYFYKIIPNKRTITRFYIPINKVFT